MRRVLVARGGALGDLVLTLPVIAALRRSQSKVHVEMLVNSPYQTLLEKCAAIPATRTLDAVSLAPFFCDAASLPHEWASWFATFDTVISYLHDSGGHFQRNVIAVGTSRFIAGPWKIGETSHAALQLAAPLRELGIEIENFAAALPFAAADMSKTIAIHPGSGSAAKNWPIEKWIELGERWLAHGRSLLVITGEADFSQHSVLTERWRNEAVQFVNQLPLHQLAPILCASLFIGHDSGISHLAAAAGAACLLLFGPTNPDVWAPLNEKVRVICAPDHDLAKLGVDVVDQLLMRIGIST